MTDFEEAKKTRTRFSGIYLHRFCADEGRAEEITLER